MKKRIVKILRTVVLLAACVAFTYASYRLTRSYLGYQNADKAYAQIDDMFLQTKPAEEITTGQSGEAAGNGHNNNSSEGDKGSLDYSSSVAKWVWDYKAMMKYNPESIGYIKLNDSRIQYPIVQHSDNDYYLKHGSNRIYNANGAIFADARIPGGLDARNCIIYGHDMLNGSMFADLLKFADFGYCKTHQTFDIYVGYRHYRYYAFASFRVGATDDKIYKLGFKDDKDFTEWVDRCVSKSNYAYATAKPVPGDRTLLLSTCVEDRRMRFVVLLKRGEEVVD